jgi:lysophospholipase
MNVAEATPSNLVNGFVACAAAELPPGGRGIFTRTSDGACLRTGVWPHEHARGTVIVMPGRTEFIEKYGEVVGDLLARNFAIGVVDWRGQGLSHRLLGDGRRGHIDTFDTYVDDFAHLASGPFAALPKPWILLAHSMGANIGTLILERMPDRFVCAALTAPMYGILTGTVPLPVARLIAASAGLGLASRYVPEGTAKSILEETFEENNVTNDPRRYARSTAAAKAEPRLVIGSPTLGWVRAALAACDELALPGAIERIRVPVLLALAGEELLIDNAQTHLLAPRFGKGRLFEIAESRHEILMERDGVRAKFWAEFDRLVAGTLET